MQFPTLILTILAITSSGVLAAPAAGVPVPGLEKRQDAVCGGGCDWTAVPDTCGEGCLCFKTGQLGTCHNV
ncbi:hypothetical protein BZA05DRAFT_400149 [Tricharina praecox]|uniref:uncharacterized protein n=1 Tax=Tricharina praecox TaxID=43433 RepID=UPI00221EACB1|nr:uncharacterized protein BZA05DRAFT_400149 [Tricharina praecox]KAI5850744.1 hypothetical protein BZA05DRAFT_400149 [Tricharina praecox]